MIALADMRAMARSYLRAARMLNRKGNDSPDASVYLCGYAVEIALKVRICRTLGWGGYPETNSEFQNFASFKMHNLEALLHLSGREARIKSDVALLGYWSVVREWNPEQRYGRIGPKTVTDAQDMTEATGRLLKELL